MGKNKHKKNFDPVKGCQEPSTGILGGFFMLLLFMAYAIFQAEVMEGGGENIRNCLSLMPESVRFSSIKRDYFDIFGIVITGFFFMVTWEIRRSFMQRTANLIIAAVAVYLAWMAAMGKRLFFKNSTAIFLGWEWTELEMALMIFSASSCVLWLISLFSSRRKDINAAPTGWAVKTGFFRWLSGLIFFTIILVIFLSHPFYRSNYYENWRITVSYLFIIYLLSGLFYAVVTNLLRKGRGEDRRDPCFAFMLIIRAVFYSLIPARGKGNKNFIRRKKNLSMILKNRSLLVAIGDMGVKFFFVPLMTTFLFIECSTFFQNFPIFFRQLLLIAGDIPKFTMDYLNEGKVGPWVNLFNYSYISMLHGIFIMDVSLGLIGYICSSRWLDNKTKSVDPTLAGWLAVLICYPPFNSITSNYLPYDKTLGDAPYLLQLSQALLSSNGTVIMMTDVIDGALKFITLIAFSVYVWATMAFGLRFSNLTNRGIITRGPYKYIRHPAYISKNLAWWTENIRSFASPWQFIFMIVWNYIYYLRAITEERHLMRDPDYAAYCSRVKHKFIPGLW
jgi:protein-S-isoprenylcysteine O-methyltransferase Ste14